MARTAISTDVYLDPSILPVPDGSAGKGTLGNGIALAFACTVPDLNCEVTAVSGGQQDPDTPRKAVNERLPLRFPREKLSFRTPAKVRSEILNVLRKMEKLEILEEVDANAKGVIVERDSQDSGGCGQWPARYGEQD